MQVQEPPLPLLNGCCKERMRMPRRHPKSVNRSSQGRQVGWRKPTSKELDLLLLAGCSCLMTVLYHPVANALQNPAAINGTSTAITTTAQIPPSPMNSFHLVPLPKQEEIQEEEA
jgi:hypothetical protein